MIKPHQSIFSHPGPWLADALVKENGLDISELARALDQPEADVAAFLEGRSRLTPEVAARWKEAFGVNPELLKKLQDRYDQVTGIAAEPDDPS